MYFPIFSAKEAKSEIERKIKGVSQSVVDAIESIEPYQGGKGHQLWVLNELNNTDKHRTIVTVGGAFQSFDFGAHASSLFGEAFPDLYIPVISAFLDYGCRMCPLEVGTELFIDSTDAKPNENLKFAFDIAIHEPGIIESESALPFLHQLTQFTEGTISAFETFL